MTEEVSLKESTLTMILEWYQGLPKPAQDRLSLYHLHVLAKRLTAASETMPSGAVPNAPAQGPSDVT